MKKRSLLFLLTALCLLYSQSLTDSLRAYYPFSGNTNDESGNGLHGTEYYGAAYSVDRFESPDSTFLSDGISSYFTTPINDTMLDSSFTLSFWTNLEYKALQSIFVWYNNDNDNVYKVHLLIYDNGKLEFHLKDFGEEADYTRIYLPDINFNTWENLTFSYDNGLWKYYINGEFIQEFTKVISQLTYSKIFWCTHEPITNTYCLNGKIDDISVYNRVLTESEINQLYANYYPPENFTAIAEEGYNKLTWDT